MAVIKDDWDKPRTQGNHLTLPEIARLRVAFNCGRKPRDAARELSCSSRVAAKYFSQFRGDTKYRAPVPEMQILAPRPAKPRFYKSNFEL